MLGDPLLLLHANLRCTKAVMEDQYNLLHMCASHHRDHHGEKSGLHSTGSVRRPDTISAHARIGSCFDVHYKAWLCKCETAPGP